MAKDDVPGFVAELRARQATDPTDLSPFALEFLVLTAVRTRQVRLMRWREVDLDTRVWISPGPQTKSGRDFRVALSPRAVVSRCRGTTIRLCGPTRCYLGLRRSR